MRRIMKGRELELFKIVEPYIVYPLQNGRAIRSDSPPEIVDAYEELRRISEAENRKSEMIRLKLITEEENH